MTFVVTYNSREKGFKKKDFYTNFFANTCILLNKRKNDRVKKNAHNQLFILIACLLLFQCISNTQLRFPI